MTVKTDKHTAQGWQRVRGLTNNSIIVSFLNLRHSDDNASIQNVEARCQWMVCKTLVSVKCKGIDVIHTQIFNATFRKYDRALGVRDLLRWAGDVPVDILSMEIHKKGRKERYTKLHCASHRLSRQYWNQGTGQVGRIHHGYGVGLKRL